MEQQNNKLIVKSKDNCYVLPAPGWNLIQEKAKKADLLPGIHVLRINKGTFSFFKDGRQPQPYVLLWISGGEFKNKTSDMPVSFSWACLNGYNDTCTLEVISTTTLHALFIDSEGEDNVGEIELSILSQNDEVASDSLPDEVEETKFAKVTEYAYAATAASDETAKKASGWYELESEDGLFRFVLKAGNGEVILTGEWHTEKESAESDIASVQESCAQEERYEKTISAQGKPCFNITDDDGQIIGSSQSYSSEASCSKGMASVKGNGSSTVLKETAEV